MIFIPMIPAARRALLTFGVCAFAVAGVAGCGGGSNSSPTSATPKGRIAFAQVGPSSQNTNNNNISRADIYIVNADGSGLKRLTTESLGIDNFSPAIAPNGNRVAFVSVSNASSDIYVVNSDGSDLRRITNDAARETSLNWTPDGRNLIFAAAPDTQSPSQIYQVNADSATPATSPTRLFGDSIARYEPTLSPDGRTLAFVTADKNGANQIYLSNAAGTSVRRLTSGELRGVPTTFTPDSKRLVYSFLPPSNFANLVYNVVNLDGTPAPDLPISSYDGGGVAFSPDGNYLAYGENRFDPSPGASNLGRNSKIYIARANRNSEPKLLAPVDARIAQLSPSWGR